MRDLPTLREDDRGIYERMLADRKSLMIAFRLQEDTQNQKRMAQVRYLHHLLASRENAINGLVARALLSRPEHSLFRALGLQEMAEGKLKKLPANRFPWFPVDGDDELRKKLLDVVSDEKEKVASALNELSSLVEWHNTARYPALEAVAIEILGMDQWRDIPESWLLWLQFVLTDKIIQKRISAKVQKYFRGETTLKESLVTLVCEQLFYSGINSAETRMKSTAEDLRAELTEQSIQTYLLREASRLRSLRVGTGIDEKTLPDDKNKIDNTQIDFDEMLDTRLKSPHREVVRLKLKMNEAAWRVGRRITREQINKDNQWIAGVLRIYGAELELTANEIAMGIVGGETSKVLDDELSAQVQAINSEAKLFKSITAKEVERIAIEAAQLLELDPP